MIRSTDRASGQSASGPRSLLGLQLSGRRASLILLFSLGVIFVSGAAYFFFAYVPAERADAQAAWKGRLSAIADDRKAAIEAWVNERTGDARLAASYPSVRSLARAQKDIPLSPGEAATRAHVIELLDDIVRIHHYEGAYIVGDDNLMIAGSDGALPLNDLEPQTSWRAMSLSKAAVDFRLTRKGDPVIVTVSPILTGGAGPEGEPSRGASLIVVSDPNKWIYPLVKAEAVPTETGEALLLRREGQLVRYLTPLRHAKAAPLSFTRPISMNDLAARHAVEEPAGFDRYRDYRGTPVLAATRRIAGTSWGFVVKVDEAEAFASAAHETRGTGLSLLLMAAALALAVAYFTRSRLTRFESALAGSEARFSHLFENANDAVIISGTDGHILGSNRRAEALYGYSRDELAGLSIRDLRAEETWPTIPDQMQQARGKDGAVFETVHVARDGRRILAEVSARFVQTETQDIFLSIIRDVSERKEAEERTRLLNRMLRTISQINNLIVHERNRDRLLSEACRILVENGEFLMAWIGVTERQVVRPVAWAGKTDRYLETVTVKIDDSEEGHGPAATSIRERRPVVANDWASDPIVEPWREAGYARGYRASASLPLVVRERAIGALTVYADRAGFFTDEIASRLFELAGALGLALDAMEVEAQRIEAVEALGESEEKLRLFIRYAPAAIAMFDRDMRYLAYSERWLADYGLGPGDLTGQSHYDVFPDIPERWKEAHRRTLAGEVEGSEEDPFPRADGSIEWVRWGSRPWHTRDGAIGGIVLFTEVVTESRETERALRESERNLRAFFESSVIGNLFGDVHGRIFAANDEFLRIVGYEREDLLAGRLRWDEMTPPEYLPLDAKAVAEAQERGVCTQFEKEYIRKDGSRVWVLIGFALVGPKREESIAFILDISERKRLQDELEERVEERTAALQAANRELEAFSYSVSHDLRAPLRAIDGFSRALEEEYGPQMDGEGRRLLRVIRDNTDNMGRLIDDLLAFSRVGKRPLTPVPIDMRELACQVFSTLVPEEGRRIEFSCDPLPEVVGDPTMLQQVWVNLLSNAVKFSARALRPAISIRGQRQDREVIYHVSDNGVGFEMSLSPKLFGVFQRLHSGEDFEGTGVGLALVQRIVLRHGGRIWAEGRVGQGATFSFALPAPGEAS